MRIGHFEIRRIPIRVSSVCSTVATAPLSEAELAAVFRIAANTPWFVAMLALVDAMEKEQITEARAMVKETNVCIAATGGGAAMEMLRFRLVQMREEAMKAATD